MSIVEHQALRKTARPVADLPPGPPRQLGTLVEVTRWRARSQGDEIAFTFLADGEAREEHLTYAALDRRARAIAAALAARGAEGERVLLVFNPGLDYNAAVYGCLYAGAVAVPVYPPDPFRAQRTLPRLLAIVEDCEAKFILSSEEFLHWARGPLGELTGAEPIALETIADDLAERWSGGPAGPQQLALLQYTSGSTDAPKGVMLTHANLMHNLAALHRLDSEGVVAVSWLPPYHDMGLIGCVMLPVHSGRRIVLMSPLAFMQRPFRWLAAISHYRGKTSGAPNFGYELCVRKIPPEERARLDLSSWTVTVNGSEPIRPETIDAFVEAFGPCGFRREAFYPAFGMAESTLLVSGGHRDDLPVERAFCLDALGRGRVERIDCGLPTAKRMIGCGQPIPDGEITIVDPHTRRRMPPGQVGEIWVRSPSVGIGYWNRPSETRRTFAARIAGERGRQYLRTGDLGFLCDGELFVAGRLKELVILGGRNYYPQDIEETIQRCHAALKRDGGAAFSVEVDGQERLVIVQEVLRPKRHDLDDVIRAVRTELAEQYELSPYAVVLIPAGTLLKTSSGKTRRPACREAFEKGELRPLAEWRCQPDRNAADGASRGAGQLPRNPLEQMLAGLWGDVLGLDQVGRDDDFFALGGHSLRAVQLVGRINAALDVELPLPMLFRYPTVAEMAAAIESLGIRAEQPVASPRGSAIPPRRPDEPGVLSFAEQRLWFLDQLNPRHPFYNMPVAARLTGPLEVAALGESLNRLAARHESLRTCFPSSGGRPVRKVVAAGPVPMDRIDLSGLPPQEREERLQESLRQHARRPFDLAEGPLVRCVLYRLGPQEHVVLLAMHHIIVDGWSLGVMAREWSALYRACTDRRPAHLPRVEVQYGDFAAWQHAHVLDAVVQREFDYWKVRLADDPPALELPADRPRPAEPDFEGALYPFELPAEVSAGLYELARREKTTLFAVLLAAYNVLLSRYCRQTDVTVGTVVANRMRKELEGTVGFFANTLALRIDVSGDPSFRELVGRAARAALEATSHQELPFDKLVELLDPRRARNMAPLFQVALVLQNMPLELAGAGPLAVEPLTIDNGTAKYDLALLVTEHDGRIGGHAEYATSLFDVATVGRMLRSLGTILAAAVEDADLPISRLPLVDDADRKRLTGELAGSRAGWPGPFLLGELFEEQARRGPERIAVRSGGQQMSYGELDRRADARARRLRSMGLKPHKRVAVCLDRSVELVVTLLGVLKAGGVYVPLDPDQPPARLRSLMEDAAPALVVSREGLLDRLPGGLPTLVVDRDDAAPQPSSNGRPGAAIAPSDLAYILYTSGSTGQPKGVLIDHAAIVNFVHGFSRALRIEPGCRVLHFFSPSSDGSISDIFSALANGACLVIAGREVLASEGGLQELVRRERVTTATLTPSMMPLLQPDELPELTTICSVGEAIAPELAARWAPGRRLINGYGVTEAACGACLMELGGAGAPRGAIGRPLDGVRMYVLDEQLQPVPPGVIGELCIGGVQVGRGYLNRPEQTARSFVADPFDRTSGARLYRTGDLARLRPDGVFEFLGRTDDQVNIRGFRVEPGEVAAVIERHPGVAQAAVVPHEDRPGSLRLVAYLGPAGLDDAGAAAAARSNGRAGDAARAAALEAARRAVPEIRSFLQSQLPSYMVPAALVVVDHLPRTVQGKLDRRALPSPSAEPNGAAADDFLAPRDEPERLVAEVWQELLGVERVGVKDSFFDLGGHSMLAVQVMAAIEQRAGRRLPLAALFQDPTVEHLAHLLRQPATCTPEWSLVPLQRDGGGRPFFCVHPAGGTVFCYRELAAQLGRERPFYGLQAVGVDGNRPPHERVEDMVAHYAAAIRSVQPRGPYLLGGWSLGGNLAFETARMLADQGEPIGLLAILDAGALRADREPGPEDFLPMVMELFPDEDNLPLEEIRGMGPREQLEYFLGRAGQARIVGGNGDLAAGRHVFEVFKTSMKAMIDYRQRPFAGRVTLLAAENRGKLFQSGDDPLLGWGRWALGGVEVHRVPGRHVHMVLQPHVRTVAAVLRDCLARADAAAADA